MNKYETFSIVSRPTKSHSNLYKKIKYILTAVLFNSELRQLLILSDNTVPSCPPCCLILSSVICKDLISWAWCMRTTKVGITKAYPIQLPLRATMWMFFPISLPQISRHLLYSQRNLLLWPIYLSHFVHWVMALMPYLH